MKHKHRHTITSRPTPITLARILQALAKLTSLAVLTAAGAGASSLDVQPVRVDLEANGEIEVLVFRNRGQEAIAIQSRVKHWLQVDGRNQFAATDELIVSPPIFTLEPGSEQVVRVGQRRPEPREQEAAYRIFFTEIPRPRAAGQSGLVLNLSLAIPVFVAPGRPERALEWSVGKTGMKRLNVNLQNVGNDHIQVKRLTLTQAETGRELSVATSLGYVLAGQGRRWMIELEDELTWPDASRSMMLSAHTDRGPHVASVEFHEP